MKFTFFMYFFSSNFQTKNHYPNLRFPKTKQPENKLK